MRGDFSRDVFDGANHYSAVLLEQGGLLTDSDWKEQADLVRHRVERETLDVVGGCGGPMAAAAFAIVPGSGARAIEAGTGSPSVLWIAGDDGYVFRSMDGGATWDIVDGGTTRRLQAIRFSGATGWAVGTHGTVLRSPDHGASWSVLPTGALMSLHGVAAVGATHAWAVGDAGSVLRTADGGATWRRETAGSARLGGVAFQSTARGIAVGAHGTIFTTGDGGGTWEARTSAVSADLHAVAFVDAANAWAAGAGGTLLRSTDGGVTWAAQPSGTTARLVALSFSSATDGAAAGEAGTLLRTTDGGTTWSALATGGTSDARGMVMVGTDLWTIADGSDVHRTSVLTGTTTDVALPSVGFSVGAGRYYVHGTLCEVESPTSYYAQPDRGPVPRLAAGQHAVYVQASQRLLSSIEAPSIREVALGDADPSTRAKTVWQVRTLPLPAASPPAWHCLSDIPALDALAWPPAARLGARSEPQVQATSLCDIGATAGYRRLENQLYRVEIQQGGATPQFKWSRENGSVAFAIDSIGTPSGGSPIETVVTLRSRGRDENLELSTGSWVEIVNDDIALEERAGPLFQFLRDGSDRMEIVLSGAVAAALAGDPSRHPLLRRWDHRTTSDSAVTLVEDSWIDLEEGVQVRFEPGGVYRPGDYWLIPARTVTGDVTWPTDASGAPIAQPPQGTEDRACRLGLITVAADGAVTVNADCRKLFPPLTALDQLLYVSGDGQEGLPGHALPQPLTVRVARGTSPVAGAVVRFEVASGEGTIVGATAGAPHLVATDAEGVAACTWTLDSALAVDARHQTLRASLLDSAGAAHAGTGVEFSANASFSLVHAGGDGQQGAAGSALDHPLEVRVANEQLPFDGAMVRYTVVAGGGSITGANPAPTSSSGIAAVGWQLGGGGPQRVDAAVVDEAGTVVQQVAFTASLGTAGTAGRGCGVTVGEGGDVPQLDADTLKRLLEEHQGQLCLCFLSGEHKVDALQVDGNLKFRLSIHGCGHASQLHVQQGWELQGFVAIEIASVAFVMHGDEGIEFRDCEAVGLSQLDVEANEDRARPVFEFGKVRHVHLAGTRMQLKTRRLAVLFADGDASIELTHCDIQGIVSFYGRPAVPELPLPGLPADQLMAALNAGSVRFAPGRGRLRLQGNRLDAIAIGREMAARVGNAATGTGAVIEGIMRDAIIVGNSFDLSASQFISDRLALSANTFIGKPVDRELAVFVAAGAAVAGNVAVEVGDHAVLRILTPKGFTERAANLVFILPL